MNCLQVWEVTDPNAGDSNDKERYTILAFLYSNEPALHWSVDLVMYLPGVMVFTSSSWRIVLIVTIGKKGVFLVLWCGAHIGNLVI